MNEVIISLVSVAFGWGLAEATYFVKEKNKARILKKALIEEIKDCLAYLQRAQLILEEWIQFAYFKKISDSIPTKSPMQIFNNHFAEVCIHFSQPERMSFNSIYQLLDVIHLQYDRIETLHPHCEKDPARLPDMNSLVEATYSNVCNAIVIIKYHIDHARKMNLSFWTDERSHQFQRDVTKKIIALLEEAKEKGLQEICKKYHKVI